MDRFIVIRAIHRLNDLKYLKSNMDRFIDDIALLNSNGIVDLKSNMDRFIARKLH